MSSHNISFHGEVRKKILRSLLSRLCESPVQHFYLSFNKTEMLSVSESEQGRP